MTDAPPCRGPSKVLRDPVSRDRILALLMEDVPGSAEQLIRIVGSSDLPVDRYLDIGRLGARRSHA